MTKLKMFMKRASDHANVSALFVVLIGAAISMHFIANVYIASLGSNLVAELIGAAVTVYGIDYLIKRREQTRLLPVVAASYEDVRLMTHWALDLWKNAYVQSVGDSLPKSWPELLSEISLKKIGLALDISKPAKIVPQQQWATYFDTEMGRIHKHAEKVLERHSGFLDPAVHNSVYVIVYYSDLKIASITAYDKQTGIPRPTNLSGYVPLITEWFDAVLAMHNWTVAIHPYLIENGITNIHAPYQFSELEATDHPPARFEDGALEAQAQAYKQWQNREGQTPNGG